jgi:hypothetical protein
MIAAAIPDRPLWGTNQPSIGDQVGLGHLYSLGKLN